MTAELDLPDADGRRAALLREFRREPATRPRAFRLRPAAPLLAAGALALTVVVATLAGTIVRDRPAPSVPAGPVVPAAEVRARLDHLDATVTSTVRSFSPDHFVYVRTSSAERWFSEGGTRRGAVLDADGLRTTEPLIPAADVPAGDPRQSAPVEYVLAHPSLSGVVGLQDGHPRRSPGELARHGSPGEVFAAVRAMLRVGGLVPERTRTWLYRAAAAVPGVTVRSGVTDTAGRSGWALTLDRQVILFDPGDGALLAESSSGTPGPAVLSSAIVRWAGVRPAK
ncbi:hypothetical protein [Cryptosporangium japonicum]|uniref:CU044_5270 family protein n=1 Tax=Cryptosporangium japonicum TaxID=80872 RepID=A0ABN0U2F0_9ACTN